MAFDIAEILADPPETILDTNFIWLDISDSPRIDNTVWLDTQITTAFKMLPGLEWIVCKTTKDYTSSDALQNAIVNTIPIPKPLTITGNYIYIIAKRWHSLRLTSIPRKA